MFGRKAILLIDPKEGPSVPMNQDEIAEALEVSDPPLLPPLMKVSTSASDDDLQPIRKRRKQIVQKKVIEISPVTKP
uniref:Uncharacterized protein n=1 Tax=Amphimedon queenslandica TaxID=400682 RepID=A0A1X7VC65_AMPQE